VHLAFQLQRRRVVTVAVLDRAPLTRAHETFLSVGGVTFRVASDDPRLASPADGPLAPFFSEHGRADVDICARWTDAHLESSGQLLFDSGGAWQLHQSGRELLFTLRSSLRGPAPYKCARFNRAFTVGDVQLSRRHYDRRDRGAVYPLEYPLDELLMIHLLSQGRGVEIHACGVLDSKDRAYVFAGQSGAGKSTMARMWLDQPGARLLTDERVVLRTDRSRTEAYGTPWHGEAGLAAPLAGDLEAVFFLHHGPDNSVIPVARSQAAARLFACSFLPFHSAAAVDRTMAAVERATKDARCYDLWFAPDRSVVDVVMSHMR
jgi:hypothetical protein